MARPRTCERLGCERDGLSHRSPLCAQHLLTSDVGLRGQDGRIHETNLDLSGQRLHNATIKDITFDGETRFDQCEFTGEVRFENCAFPGYTRFVSATAERLAFRDCRFGNIVDLENINFAELSIRRSEFGAPVELALPWRAAVDIHLTTFSGKSRLIGGPCSLELRRVSFRNGAHLRLDGSQVMLHDVEFGGPSSFGPPTESTGRRPRLLDLAGTDLSQFKVFLTDLSRCTFIDAHNLDGFDFGTLDAFDWAPPGPYTRRRVLWDERRTRFLAGGSRRWWSEDNPAWNAANQLGAKEVAQHYRSLRKGREEAKDEPGAADFYYGEMEMRRLARRAEMYIASGERRWAEWTTATAEHALLWLYWAVSGYGLRAWRALAALVVVLLAASVIFRYAGFPGDTHTYAASLRFSVQSAMSLLRGTDEPLTPTGEWVALALRLLGPLLFGLALLAVRGRVRR